VGQNVVQNQGIQNVGNQNRLSVILKIANQHGNGNVVAARAKGNGNGINGNPISNSQITPETQTLVISNDVEEDNHDLDIAHMHNGPFFAVEESPKTPTFRDDSLHESIHDDSNFQGSSSNIRQTHTPFESVGRWTKDHHIANVISDPSGSVLTRKQLQTSAMWCFFDAF
nr:hypothetical protein [Tanacetum cinerariifolium]